MYHKNYGSRVPPEVGAVQGLNTLQHIAAYAVAAMQADPRVAQVLNPGITGSPSGVPGLVSFAAVVQPIGPTSTPVEFSQVIGI